MNQLQGHSITYRIAVGPHQGRKLFTACAARYKPCLVQKNRSSTRRTPVAGFSLHASVAVKVSARKK